MLRIDSKELLLLKGGGGEPFARFVDGLIRGEVHVGGLPQSEVDTQCRVNIPDGGVDTRVRRAIPRDQSGYLSAPTCWQYKSETYKELAEQGTRAEPLRFLTREITKPAVSEMIAKGHAYRFCLLGDMPPATLVEWEQHLLTESKKIAAAALLPKVITGEHLAAWSERFPAVTSLIRPFSIDLQLFNIQSWGSNARAVTQVYVSVDGWSVVSADILSHANLGKNVLSPCLPLQGEAGVGKTRLIFETLVRIAGAESLVMYTADEQIALNLSIQLATHVSRPAAIVVADECQLQTRLRIEQNVRGCSDRVRFICISNTGERGISGAAELWLDQMPGEAVAKILEKNFPNIPAERRGAYAELAGGFVQLAADLCVHHELLAPGDLGPALNRISDYVRNRLGVEDEEIVSAISLFTIVGASGDVAVQLLSLCKITGMLPDRVRSRAQRLKESPGFIKVAGRFLYVTPAIVARVAFERGWQRWVAADPKHFIESLDPDLVRPFLDRVRNVATEEVKAAVAGTFRQWISSRQPKDLADRDQIALFTKLIETDPGKYLPVLRHLVEGASGEQLGSRSEHGGGSRREIVWLIERLAAFTEFYADCEAIMYRLAVHECEPNLGNNATALWQQFQRIFLSGSATPFSARFEKLKQRMSDASGPTVELCFGGLSEVFASNVSRMGAPATVGGRLRPEDWRPQTNDELRHCWELALEFLRELVAGGETPKSGRALKLITSHLHSLLHGGFFDEVKSILSAPNLTPPTIPEVIEGVEVFLERAISRGDASESDVPPDPLYVEKVKRWLEEMKPHSFDGRLRLLLSRKQWHESLRETDGQPNATILKLAEEAIADPKLLVPEIPFLLSKEAESAVLFGDAVGRCDKDEALLPLIFDSFVLGCNDAFLRGYVFGALRRGGLTPRLVEKIDRISEIDARTGLEMRFLGGDQLDAYAFATRSVNSGTLPVTVLSNFAYAYAGGRPSISRIREILSRLTHAAGEGIEGARLAAVKFLWALRHGEESASEGSALRDEQVRELAWNVLAIVPDDESGNEAYDRAELLGQLSRYDARRASRLLLASSVKRGYGSIHDQSVRMLAEIAPIYPAEVMEALGGALMEERKGIGLSLGGGATLLIRSLPPSTVVAWVRRGGSRTPRVIARQLPLPYVDKNGVAIVPEATLAILEEFGSDVETCDGFLSGSFRGDSWWGNGAEHFRAKAAVAMRFLQHENKCVRRWAEIEVLRCEGLAAEEQVRHEERMIP